MDGHKVVVVGLISDTHGVLDEATVRALERTTDTIIHAGDVGDKNHKSRLSAEQIIAQLQGGTNKSIVAISGNVDEGHTDLPHSVSVTIHGKNILVEHICGFPPRKELEERVLANCIDIVVFGHSHLPGVWWHNNVLYVNPGSAGPRRFKLPRCIAFLMIHSTGDVEVEFTPIGCLPQDTIGLPSPFKIPTKSHDKSDERSEMALHIGKFEEFEWLMWSMFHSFPRWKNVLVCTIPTLFWPTGLRATCSIRRVKISVGEDMHDACM